MKNNYGLSVNLGKKVDYSRLNNIIGQFGSKRVLVIGDLMLDQFIWGDVSRISPEAPVPVVKVQRETVHLGGAGNVVNNIVALGAQCSVIGVIGRDTSGKTLTDELAKKGVRVDGLCTESKIPTIIKTRIIAGSQQVVRVDREELAGFRESLLNELFVKIRHEIKNADAVIISDYGKGVVCSPVIKLIISLCKKNKIPVIVDPKIEHFQLYRYVTCITPNTKEAMEGMFFRKVSNEKDVEELGKKIMKKLKTESLLITRGEHGMSLFEKNGSVSHIPTVAREVFDVTGAGDTVISVFTLAYVSGAKFFESAFLSNIAGGIVVGKVGTATTSRDELAEWMRSFGK